MNQPDGSRPGAGADGLDTTMIAPNGRPFLRKSDLEKFTLSNSSTPFDDSRAIAHLHAIAADLEEKECAFIDKVLFS